MRRSLSLALVLVLALPACADDGGDGGDRPPLPEPIGQFPDGFLWGTAIAPYQVEGGLHATDWYQWESLCSHCSGDSADDGPGFLDRHEADLDAAVAMSNNAIRLGFEWGRIFPTEASFPDAPDATALARYHAVLAAARARGITVMGTLIHFSLPSWLHDLTDRERAPGWEDPAIVARIAAWADFVGREFGADVDLWITLNEPFVNVVGGWISGDVPPGKTFDVTGGLEVGVTMIRAHAAAYDALHAADTFDADDDGVAARVSIAQHSRVFVPRDPANQAQVDAADMFRYLLNHYFLIAVTRGDLDTNYDFDVDDPDDVRADPTLAGRLDYIGLNYYGLTVVLESTADNFPLIGLPFTNDLDRHGVDAPMSDFGWAIHPAGFRTVLDELVPYDLPILITENGVADAADTLRPRFLVDHLYELGRAIDDGVPVEGYFHWSLLDNFEWGSGYCPRFGLLRVDFTDPARPRTAGAGAEVYRRIIDDNTVAPALFAEHAYGAPGYCPRVGI
jgi:beta-glucosidase/6-phospho-beta-glucosidase/beta-galactosidase